MKTDGKFIIESGGITQGIQKELGLSNEECKQLQKNSVWEQIINEVDNNVTVENNNNEKPNKENGYKVYKNAVISFTKDAWQRIVTLVKKALNKNIEIEEPETSEIGDMFNQLLNQIKSNSNNDNDIFVNFLHFFDIDPKNITLKMNVADDIKKYSKLNNIEYANQRAVKIGEEWFDFDDEGNVEKIYKEEPNGLEGSKTNHHAELSYWENNEVVGYMVLQRNPDSSISKLYYGSDGILQKIYNDNNHTSIDVKNAILVEQILLKAQTQTKEELYATINKVHQYSQTPIGQKLGLKFDHFLCSINDRGENFLEQLAKIEPNGKELANYIIEQMYKNINKDNKYVTDIESDMNSHRNDYHKLAIDLIRMIRRPVNKNRIDSSKNKTLAINNEIDERVEQGFTGDCFLISSLLNITDPIRNKEARQYIKSLISHDTTNHTVTVNLKGVGHVYTFSEEEIVSSNYLSFGDPDLRIFEIAIDKYKRDLSYNSNKYLKPDIIEGGTQRDVINALYGNRVKVISCDDPNSIDIANFNAKNTTNTFSFGNRGYGLSNIDALDSKNRPVKMFFNHEYNIIKSDKNYVYFTNPHNTNPDDIKNFYLGEGSTILKLPIKQFLELEYLNIDSYCLPTMN